MKTMWSNHDQMRQRRAHFVESPHKSIYWNQCLQQFAATVCECARTIITDRGTPGHNARYFSQGGQEHFDLLRPSFRPRRIEKRTGDLLEYINLCSITRSRARNWLLRMPSYIIPSRTHFSSGNLCSIQPHSHSRNCPPVYLFYSLLLFFRCGFSFLCFACVFRALQQQLWWVRCGCVLIMLEHDN